MNKAKLNLGVFISGNQTQSETHDMKIITNMYAPVFQGLGSAKVGPMNIKTDESVKPVQ